jgi:iron complex outermembrane receptor protein
MRSRAAPAALAATLLSLPAGAQEGSLVLEEVLVTAQKKSESLAETPMTVNVVDGDTFNDFASFDFRDLDRFLAGVAVTGLDFDVDVAVRGLGSNLNAAVDPRVSFYWDGAFSVRQLANFTSQFDLERFELLRGPQGTLYGKTSPAGALTMQSRNPNLENMDGYLQQAISERDGFNTQAGLSIPLIENQLGLRISGVYDENRNQDIENITLGIANESETRGARGVLLWQPGDSFDLRLSYNYVEAEKDIDSIVQGADLDFEDRKAVNEYAATSDERHSQAVLEINWELPNEWLLTSVSSYQRSKLKRDYDSDQSDVLGQNQYVVSDIDGTYNQELRLQSTGNEFWDWTAGVFYQDSDAETPVFVDNYVVVGIPLVYQVILAEVSGPAVNDAEDIAVFLHNAFNLSENGTLTVGIRYNELERYNEQLFLQEAYLLLGEEKIGPLDVQEIDGVPDDAKDLEYDAWSGTVKYQHQLDQDLMVYASYDRGWRSGSANIAGQPAPPVWAAFEEEISDNFEVGLKLGFGEGRGLFNASIYYQVYDDFHFGADNVLYVAPDGSFAQGSPVVNADEVVSKGFEVELSYLLSETWTVNASLSYNSTEFEKFPDAPCNDATQELVNPGDFATCDLEGEPAGNQPEWSGVIISEYFTSVGEGGWEWYLRGLLKAEDEREDTDTGLEVDSYAFLDLFTGFRSADDRWDVSVWAKNVLDEETVLNYSPTIPVPDYSRVGQIVDEPLATIDTGLTRIENLLAPRTLGATVALRF